MAANGTMMIDEVSTSLQQSTSQSFCPFQRQKQFLSKPLLNERIAFSKPVPCMKFMPLLYLAMAPSTITWPRDQSGRNLNTVTYSPFLLMDGMIKKARKDEIQQNIPYSPQGVF